MLYIKHGTQLRKQLHTTVLRKQNFVCVSMANAWGISSFRVIQGLLKIRVGLNPKPQAGCRKSGHLVWVMRHNDPSDAEVCSQDGYPNMASHLYHIHFAFQLTFLFPSRKMSQNYLHKYQVHSLWLLCTQRELAVSKVGSSHSSDKCSDSLQKKETTSSEHKLFHRHFQCNCVIICYL